MEDEPVLHKDNLAEMAEIGNFVELPICPLCGELTLMTGAFLPCCGEETDGVEPEEWFRLYPSEIVKD